MEYKTTIACNKERVLISDERARARDVSKAARRARKLAVLKADMKSYILLETAAIFFLANLFLKQGISSEYVTVDFICMG